MPRLLRSHLRVLALIKLDHKRSALNGDIFERLIGKQTICANMLNILAIKASWPLIWLLYDAAFAMSRAAWRIYPQRWSFKRNTITFFIIKYTFLVLIFILDRISISRSRDHPNKVLFNVHCLSCSVCDEEPVIGTATAEWSRKRAARDHRSDVTDKARTLWFTKPLA